MIGAAATQRAPGARASVWCAWVTPVIVFVAAVALRHGVPGHGLHAHWLAVAVICVAVGHLSWPARCPGGLLAWPLLMAGTALAVMPAAIGASQADLAVVAALALGVALLGGVLDGFAALLVALRVSPGAACASGLALFAVAAAAPLWLGPWAELSGGADLVIAVSPLSYLAALAQYDYLRGQWFYVHSPLGSLRFDYPDPAAGSAACVVLAAACRVLARCVGARTASAARDARDA